MAFNRRRAARVLAEATTLPGGDQRVAERHRVSRHTVSKWRKRLLTDPELVDLYMADLDRLGEEWAGTAIEAIREGLEAMRLLFRQAQAQALKPEWNGGVLREVAGGCKIIGELQVVREALGVASRPEAVGAGQPPAEDSSRPGSDPAVTPLH